MGGHPGIGAFATKVKSIYQGSKTEVATADSSDCRFNQDSENDKPSESTKAVHPYFQMRLCELKPEAHKSAIPASHKNQRPAFTTRKIECASRSLRLTIAKTAAQITKGPSNQTRKRTTFEEFICVVLMIRPIVPIRVYRPLTGSNGQEIDRCRVYIRVRGNTTGTLNFLAESSTRFFGATRQLSDSFSM